VWRIATAAALALAAASLVVAVLALREARHAHEPPTYGEISEAAIRQLGEFAHEKGGMTPDDARRALGMPTEVFRDNPRALCWRYETPFEIRMCWGPKRQRAWIAHSIPRSRDSPLFPDRDATGR
jgi:hypothetical protein